ncbi:hypothetical protein DLM75_21510, partial [Leptospira stimsonii]
EESNKDFKSVTHVSGLKCYLCSRMYMILSGGERWRENSGGFALPQEQTFCKDKAPFCICGNSYKLLSCDELLSQNKPQRSHTKIP